MTDSDELQGLGTVSVHPDTDSLAAAAAGIVQEVSEQSVAEHGSFLVVLAGGNTPKRLYELLAAPPWRDRMRWETWEVYFGDERAVPPDDEQSNYHLAATTLLSKVAIDDSRVHRMLGEQHDLDAAADEYHRLIQDTVPGTADGVPRFDLVLLGLGENGHTASLFPGTAALEVRDRWATRGRADYAPFDRITLTYPVLNAARVVAFTVAGSEKHEALHHTARGSTPAAGVKPHTGPPRWLLDAAASKGDAQQQ